MTITAGPFSQADGPQTIDLAADSWAGWHEIAVSVVDSEGVSVTPTAGSLAGAVLGVGADVGEDFTNTLNLAGGERRWTPFFSFVSSITFTPTALDADKFYTIVIINTVGTP